jgi:hypothetical protein
MGVKMEFYIALIGLAGALIGSLASIVTIYIQTKIQDRREKSKLIYNAAIEEYKSVLNVAKDFSLATKTDVSLHPLVSYTFYHTKIFDLVEKGNLNSNTLKEVDKEFDEIKKWLSDKKIKM